jgi:hypothetical protein
MSYRPLQIKSIQRGTITLTGVASNTATISSVDTANAYVAYLGHKDSDTVGNNADNWVRLDLTNATTVTATRAGSTGNVVVSFEVVEYYPGRLRSLQTVSITITNGNASNTATLGTTLQSTAKAVIIWAGNSSSPTAVAPDSGWGKLVLTNTTTVTLERTGTAGTMIANGTVVEFK